MTKSYEEILGGVVDDFGFAKFGSTKSTDQGAIMGQLLEAAKKVSLEEEDVTLGNVRVSLRGDGVPYLETLGGRQFLFSPWAMTQLNEKMGMGASGYIKRCLYNDLNELVPININRWLEHNSSKQVVFRIHTNYTTGTETIRAIVSDRYGFFDHLDMLECISEAIVEGDTLKDGLQIASASITPDNMSLRIIDPTKVIIQGVGNDDGSTIGTNIRNGQTGQSRLNLEFMIYTYICSNGLFVGTDRSLVYSKKHYSIEREEFKEGFLRSIEKFPDYIAATYSLVELSRNIKLSDIFRTEDDIKAYLTKYLGLSDTQVEQVSSIQEASWESSVWGLSGAVTQYAQLVGNSSKQYDLEKAAGNMIEYGIRVAA